jgi:protease-4
MRSIPILAPLLAGSLLASAVAARQLDGAGAGIEAVRLAEIRLRGSLPDQPDAPSPLLGGGATLRAAVERLRRAAEDESVQGVVLHCDEFGAGLGKATELRRALARLRAAGKKTVARASSLGLGAYLLAAGCEEISLEPGGLVYMPGLRMSATYFRGLLEKIGVRFDVVHVGEFKTAFEEYYLEEMSEPQRESLGAILDDLYGHVVEEISSRRGLTPEQVRAAIDAGILTPEQARARRLVDAVEYDDELRVRLAGAFGAPVEIVEGYGRGGLEDFDLEDPAAIFELLGEMFRETPKPKEDVVAVVYANGIIVPGKSEAGFLGSAGTVGSRTMREALREAAADEHVKAIVLRIDSPGGSGSASDEIWREVVRAKARKPLVVSMSDVAASGGYYIAMGADAIVAEPTTITGSIGVVSAKPVFEGLYGKVGMNAQSLERGARAGMFSTDRSFTVEEREALRRFSETFYRDFVEKAASGRSREVDEIEPLARGRVWSGRRALEIGLVDRLGGLGDAIALAMERAGLDPASPLPVYELPRPPSFAEMLEEGGLPFVLARAAASSRYEMGALLPSAGPSTGRLASLLRVLREPALAWFPLELRLE